MSINELWDELNNLYIDDEPKIAYKDINRLINENPDKLVGYFDGLFKLLSIERMKQLAQVNKVYELSMEYFTIGNLRGAWNDLRKKMNCSFNEYLAATEYCKISEAKFKRTLTFNDAQQAFKSLIFIAKVWGSNNSVFEIYSSAKIRWDEELFTEDKSVVKEPDQENDNAMKEVAITVVEKVNQPVSIEQKTFQLHEESEFIAKLRVLQSSSKESVVHADSFGQLRDYMHVNRPIQMELEKILTEVKSEEKSSLILLCGSVGDGKSHLLAYMKDKHPDLVEDVIIHNDSTESFDPNQNSLETLEQVLLPYDDLESNGTHTIIAINLGVLHNFYRRQREAGRFTNLCDYIDRSGIFERTTDSKKEDSAFRLLNFAEAQSYILTDGRAKSPYFLELFNKVTSENANNPFYSAWVKDREQGINSAAHENYNLLQQSIVKESIVQSLIEAMIKQKVFISTRTFYNFLYEIIVPVDNKIGAEDTQVAVEDMLPNLMYGHPDRSLLLTALSKVDPLKNRLEKTDRLVSEFILSSDPTAFVNEKLGKTSTVGAWKQVQQMIKKGQQIEYSRLLLRHHELLYKEDYDETYREYVNYLFSYYKGNEDEIGELFNLIEKVIFAWKGSPKGNYVFMDTANKNFRMAVEIKIEPVVDENIFASTEDVEEVNHFTPSIPIGYAQNGEEFLFELDYKLYLLLKKVGGGYRPNRQDIQDALQFSEFHDRLLKSTDKTKSVLLVHKKDGAMLEVKKPKFSKAKFEVEKVN